MSEIAPTSDANMLKAAGERMLARYEHTFRKHRVRELLWQAQNGNCVSCGMPMVSRYRYETSGDRDTLDHLWPKSLGGRDGPGNFGLMHHKCNAAKASRLPNAAELERLGQLNAALGWPTKMYHGQVYEPSKEQAGADAG